MAVLTDILIAPTQDAPAIIANWPVAKNWPGLQTTGLDALVLSDLAEALGQSALAIAIEELDPHSFNDEANGPWLYVLPNDLRDHLANLKADDLGPIARTWSQQEEAMARGMTEDDATRLLLQIQSLATTARNDQKPMLLWVSL
jgi:hypothetical protein